MKEKTEQECLLIEKFACAKELLKTAVTEATPALLIKESRQDYQRALAAIDSNVPLLIEKGQELKALCLLSTSVNMICEIHNTLREIYNHFFEYKGILRQLGSARLQKLGHDLSKIYKEGADFIDNCGRTYKYLGYDKQHPIISPIILNETEYMLDVLSILIEPDYVPLEECVRLEDNVEELQGRDRYIPPVVKISVWRRDQGKCVKCGTNEKLEYDHIIPVSKGGSNTERNVQLLCEKCNREKAVQIS